jgi:anti-sigma factor RsiW
MKPQNLHAHEDRLLDFAYGELPAQEARLVESHLQGCTRCTELLDGIRGVRTTMAQLPMEPAPDAGLESLLAYAQQAARNAAAGPPLKPTWWRRWLVPVMGVAAVSVFGIVTVQVNKSVDLSAEQAVTASRASKEEPAPVASAPPAPDMLAENAPPSAATPAAPMAEAAQAPSEPVAKLDSTTVEKLKSTPRRKSMKPSPYDADSDWSNAGAGVARAAEEESVEDREYGYDRRDAMTQAGAFNKPKPMLVGKTAPSKPSTAAPAPTAGPVQAALPPPPAAAQPGAAPADEYAAGADMDGEAMAPEAQVQQQGPTSGSLRVGDSRRGATQDADKQQEDDSFDSLFGRSSEAKREQYTRAPQVASIPKAASAAAPAERAEAEKQGPSPAELSKQATAAMRSGDHVREVMYLRQALEAGATGKERLGLLNRLCEAEFAIGRREAALEACNLVLKEAPRSSAAQVARRRLSEETPAQAKPDSRYSAPKSTAPLKADEMPSAPAPAH